MEVVKRVVVESTFFFQTAELALSLSLQSADSLPILLLFLNDGDFGSRYFIAEFCKLLMVILPGPTELVFAVV